jgi:2-dehydropantoate 2-reductase
MRMLVVGAGSVGGYFGGRLVEAGRDVTFLVRPARAAALAAHGLQIESPGGDLTLRVATTTVEGLAPYDVVLVAVKAFALEAAIADFAPAVGSQTLILPVLNGMGHLDVLAKHFGERRTIGGVCLVATMLDAAGVIHQLNPQQSLAYGELDGFASERLERFHAFCSGGGFEAKLSTDILQEMWEKWLLLASLGAVTCLMRAPIGTIVGAPEGRSFLLNMLDEAIQVISAVGRPPRPDVVERARLLLTAQGSPLTSSMFRDLDARHPVEVEQILGDLVRRGQGAGLATPLLAAAYTHLSIYQSSIDAAPAGKT